VLTSPPNARPGSPVLPQARKTARQTLDVALVVPLQGPAGIFGLSCELCAQLAAEEVNAEGGVLGRELRFVVVDGGRRPAQVAADVDRLLADGAVEAVTGWHISAVRNAVAPRIAGRAPYVYTPLYEGGERRPGVFLTGETPDRQVQPALHWLRAECGARRWAVVGDDYIWPRQTARATRRYAAALGAKIALETFVPLGTTDFTKTLRAIEARGCDLVLMLLVGDDAVNFNRQFAARGLDAACLRFSPLMEENMLLATGAENTRSLFSAAGFFEALPSAYGLDFSRRYTDRFGVEAPILNSLGESCYEGVKLLATLIGAARSTNVADVCAVADNVSYEGARGLLHLHDHHLDQPVYLSVADGLEFDVLAKLEPPA
jgi:ABC-type branched-subunit amino acid transport system substrate-binding protein